MALPLKISVKEWIKALCSLQHCHGSLISKRLQMLIELKKHEETSISKINLSKITGINPNSIVSWRKIYLNDGIQSLLVHNQGKGLKRSVVNAEEQE